MNSKLNLLSIIFYLAAQVLVLDAHHVVTQLSVYYESLCPDSKRFFIRQLAPTFEKLNRYMDVELVPFGNANVSYPRHDNKPEFHCQHGPQECNGNRIQSCVIEMLKNTEESIRFVKCMFEDPNWKDTNGSAQRCADKLSLDWLRIKACNEGSEGERLLIANSLKTFNLVPEHTYVPWIVIDKVHTQKLQTDAEHGLLKFLCKNYFNHEPLIQQCKDDAIEMFQKQTGAASLVSMTPLAIVSPILATLHLMV